MILAEAFQYLAEFLVVWLTGKSHPLDLLCKNLKPVRLPAGVLAHLLEAVALFVAFQKLQHLLTTRLLLVKHLEVRQAVVVAQGQQETH